MRPLPRCARRIKSVVYIRRRLTGTRRRVAVMNLKLAGKVVLITGASKGIGLASAIAFAGEGARLLLAARGADGLTAAATAASAAGAPEVATATCDVTVDADVEQLMATARQRFGRIDVLVNNAAGKLPAGEFADISNDAWLAGWNQKLQCHIRACRPACRSVWGCVRQCPAR